MLPARTLPFSTIRVCWVPLPHKRLSATSCTLHVPSNLAGLAKADPDRITLVVRTIRAQMFFAMAR
jgi:hypothetical protein